MQDLLKQRLRTLPEKPGVYKYFDESGVIIYVGKARNLKKRVNSYFTKQHDNRKTGVLVKKISHIDFTVVETEWDALLLENSLIKEFQPRYNINLKDDKSYPYIRVTNERFPKVYAMRNPLQDGSLYFGPYASPKVMNTVLDLARKLYPTRNCNLQMTPEKIAQSKFSICLEYQIGNCLGPCEGKQSENDYNNSIQQIKQLLRGNLGEIKKHLRAEMQTAAGELRFEEAQQCKEKLDALENYRHKSTVVTSLRGNVAVFGVSSTDKFAFVNVLYVAEGIIVRTHNLEVKKKLDETDADIMQQTIVEIQVLYADELPAEWILPFPPETDADAFVNWSVPKAGDRRKLLELSLKNAMLFRQEKLNQYEKLNPEVRIDRLMEQMRKDLRLQAQPRHMECFDNSNFQGTYPVSACVVFNDGKPTKSEYRHFNVKTVEGPNDFATMREVIQRRYSRLIEENKSLPQLILIDGGKGQLSAAVEVLKQLGIYGKVAVIGIAKRLEELYYPEDSLPLYLDKKSETLKVIQQMRDEAHRFGITHHRNRRSKGLVKSALTHIPGIGSETAALLLKSFKSVGKIRVAGLTELSAVIGEKKAIVVFRHFHPTAHENG
ncbi:MAG: excinuclease ABC subunit C [Bacteroidetes bacterium]|nr:excinuclease ABC subunit C [Bacteroidota bacterium]